MSVHHSAALAQKFVLFRDVEKEPEVPQDDALHTVGVEGAREMVATKVLRARPSTAKLTEGEGAAKNLGAPRALRAVLITASPMVVADVVSMKVVGEQQEGNLAAVLDMVVEKGVNR